MTCKFFDLKILSDTGEETTYLVSGLDEIYVDPTFSPCSGATALLRSERYPGYCQLFYSHRKYDNSGIITCTFTPAKTKDGDLIFVKYNKDHLFCIFYSSSVSINKPSRIIINSIWGVQ